MATSLDFQRQDGAVSRMDREFKAATKNPLLLPAYFNKCKFSDEDEKWWERKENVTPDNLFSLAHAEVASHGLLYARMKNWACGNWHEYQVLVRGTPGVAEEMSKLIQAYSEAIRKESKMATTGLSSEAQKHLEKWRKVYKHLIRAERVVESVGVAIRKASVDRVEAMRAKRRDMVGPWETYLSLEASDLMEEATPDEREHIVALQFKGTHTLATAKLTFNALWTDRRKMKLVSMAANLSQQKQLPAPPPLFAYDMTQPVMDGILSAPPSVPATFLNVLPSEPGPKFYSAGSSNSGPAKAKKKRARESPAAEALSPPMTALSIVDPVSTSSKPLVADEKMDDDGAE